MTPSARVFAVLREAEGLRLHAYKPLAHDVWTIGYGHTRGVNERDICTAEQAEAWLQSDVACTVNDITKLVKVALTQGQFDALVTFVFQFGFSKFSTSKMLKYINARYYWSAYGEFKKWIHDSTGRELEALMKRRKVEAVWWAEMPGDAPK